MDIGGAIIGFILVVWFINWIRTPARVDACQMDEIAEIAIKADQQGLDLNGQHPLARRFQEVSRSCSFTDEDQKQLLLVVEMKQSRRPVPPRRSVDEEYRELHRDIRSRIRFEKTPEADGTWTPPRSRWDEGQRLDRQLRESFDGVELDEDDIEVVEKD